MKTVQIRSYFWTVFSPNTGKYGPEITPYLDTFYSVSCKHPRRRALQATIVNGFQPLAFTTKLSILGVCGGLFVTPMQRIFWLTIEQFTVVWKMSNIVKKLFHQLLERKCTSKRKTKSFSKSVVFWIKFCWEKNI